jgi:hypothetical protein
MRSATAMFGSLLFFVIKAKGPILLACGNNNYGLLKLFRSYKD